MRDCNGKELILGCLVTPLIGAMAGRVFVVVEPEWDCPAGHLQLGGQAAKEWNVAGGYKRNVTHVSPSGTRHLMRLDPDADQFTDERERELARV